MDDFERPRGTEENLARARKIESHLRLPTLPVGIKIYKNEDSVPEGVGEEPDFAGTFCQFVSYSRFERCQIRKNYLLKRKAITCPFSPGVLGFEDWTGHIATGEHMGGVHFESAEAARRSQEGLSRLEPFTVQAIVVGPLQDLSVEPDVIGFATLPGMTNKIFDGAMWNTGKPKEITYYNICGVCATGVAQAYMNRDLFVVFPCHGARRIGIFTDTELFTALNTGFFNEWVLGMEKSFATGHSFPVGHMLRPNPPLPPHFKILEWPDNIVSYSEWEKEQEEKQRK